jgi:hypothetical protein
MDTMAKGSGAASSVYDFRHIQGGGPDRAIHNSVLLHNVGSIAAGLLSGP